MVRILGAGEKDYLQVPATVNTEDSTFSFSLPEEIGQLNAEELKGKLKLYSVAISLDGGSNFDRSETPILLVK